jgi:hypothetical protein
MKPNIAGRSWPCECGLLSDRQIAEALAEGFLRDANRDEGFGVKPGNNALEVVELRAIDGADNDGALLAGPGDIGKP